MMIPLNNSQKDPADRQEGVGTRIATTTMAILEAILSPEPALVETLRQPPLGER